MFFRHKALRKHQDALIKNVNEAIDESAVLLAHAPMGLGKTDAVLSPALEFAVKYGRRVLFLTPKISQHEIALDVIKGLNKKHGLNLRAIDLIGRKHACIHPSLANLDHDSFYTICKRLRREELCPFHRKAVGYTKAESQEAEEFLREVQKEGPALSHKDVLEFGRKKGLCPYELMLRLAKDAHLIIADYYHFFIPSVRDILMRKINAKYDDLIVVVDEGHNLPDRLRSYLSKSISMFILKHIDKEIEMVGSEKLHLDTVLTRIEKEYLSGLQTRKKEALVKKEVVDLFVKKAEMKNVEDLIQYLYNVGEAYTESTNQPSSAIRMAKFLEVWTEEEIGSIRLIRKTGKTTSLTRKSLDPSSLSNVLNEVYAGVIMSGTLTPLNMYEDILNIRKAIKKAYKSPFPKQNKLSLIVKGLTSKYTRRGTEMYKLYADKIDAMFNTSPGSMAVFFPSFEFLTYTKQYIKSLPLLIQKPNASPIDNAKLVSHMKGNKSLLLGVQGGSLAEGINLPSGEVKVLVIAGLALNDMTLETKALIEYYNKKFGKGWDYAYTYPAVTKALQAAGRAIRKETDKAVVVFMDERFGWANYFKLLPFEEYRITYEPEKHIRAFFKGGH